MTIIDQKALATLIPDESLRHHITQAVEHNQLEELKEFLVRQQLASDVKQHGYTTITFKNSTATS